MRFQNLDISSESGKEYRVGRPTIPDNILLGSRNAWAWLLEESWAEVGWALQCIRSRRKSTIEDVRRAMASLKDKPNGGIAAAFYRESPEAGNANANEIRKDRVRIGNLLDPQILAAQAKRDDQQRLCWEAEAALKEVSPKDKDPIQLEAARRKQFFLELEENLKNLENEREVLYKRLLDREAHFCCSEMLDFLRSRGRYAISPRSLANALAGLPTMRWRQSYSRCSKMPYDFETHLWYQVLENIKEIWKHRPAESAQPTEEFFRTQLLNLPEKTGYVRQFLWEHWRDLRLALEDVCQIKHPAQSIPFVLTTVFLQNLNRPKNAAERVLAGQEKLGD